MFVFNCISIPRGCFLQGPQNQEREVFFTFSSACPVHYLSLLVISVTVRETVSPARPALTVTPLENLAQGEDWSPTPAILKV